MRELEAASIDYVSLFSLLSFNNFAPYIEPIISSNLIMPAFLDLILWLLLLFSITRKTLPFLFLITDIQLFCL